MQIYLHLYSEWQARLCFNNDYFLILEEKAKKKVKVVCSDALFLEFVPINTSTLASFLCELHLENGSLYSKSDNIKIIKLNNDNFYIMFYPKRQNVINAQSVTIKEIAVKGKKVIYAQGRLEIIDKTKHLIEKIHNPQCLYTLTEQNGLITLFTKESENNNLHILQLNSNNILHISADKYQIKNNEIQSVKALHTFAKHNRITCYDANTLQKIKEYTAYKFEPNINLPKIILPYAFMQCLQVSDYKLAGKFLDQNIFKGSLTKEKVAGFFGDFVSIITPQVKKEEFTLCLLYKTNNSNILTSKYYTFEFNNDNKITNIKPCF